MHFVAGGTKLRRLILHKRLEKGAAVRLRIELDGEVVQCPHHGIPARRQLVHLGILEMEIALAHRAFHVGDGVAHHTA